MSPFPTYYGPSLPDLLQFWNPRHWLLLLEWVFLKPSRLKHYLYKADPSLHSDSFLKSIIKSQSILIFRNRTYRSVLFSALAIVGILVTLLNLSFALIGFPVDWIGVAVSVDIGIGIFLIGYLFRNALVGIVGGVSFGVGFGLVLGVVGGVVTHSDASLSVNLVLTFVFGIILGLAFTSTLSAMFSVAQGLGLGVVLTFSVSIAMFTTLITMRSASMTVVEVVLYSLVLPCGFLVGILHLPIWIFQLFLTLQIFDKLSWFGFRQLPTIELFISDELAILPFPRTEVILAQCLQRDSARIVQVFWTVSSNPFKATEVSNTICQHFEDSHQPLVELYRLLSLDVMDEVSIEPFGRNWQFDRSSARLLILTYPIRAYVSMIYDDLSTTRMVSWIIDRLYETKIYTLDPFIRVLWFLEYFDRHSLSLREVERVEISASSPDSKKLFFEDLFDRNFGLLTDFLNRTPYGSEINQTFYVMYLGVKAKQIDEIVRFQARFRGYFHVEQRYLRPDVVQAIIALNDISLEVQRYSESSSSAVRAAALNRATGMLAELAHFISGIRLSERVLLRAAVEQWQEIVAETAQRLGEQSLREMGAGERRQLTGGEDRLSSIWQRPALPFESPYVAGRPVQPPLFVGRGDIFNRIFERWQGDHTPDSVILYGHRRMGKTSILRGLLEYAPPGSLLIYVDLKGEQATIRHLGDLFFVLADELYANAQSLVPNMSEPDAADYSEPAAAKIHFQRLLRAVRDGLPTGGHIIMALDEFEALQEEIESGGLPLESYDLIRTLSQQERVALVLAGLHTLDEMSRDYRQAFYSSFVNVKVSYLTPEASEQLIARPTQDFRVNYHADVISEIHRLTHGQPLLIQRICQELISRLNHELFDLDIQREARILPSDLDAILTDSFIRSESRYFDGIWTDQIEAFPEQRTVLFALAAADASQSPAELAATTGSSTKAIADALNALERRDVIGEQEGHWSLLMPLFRRWLRLVRDAA